MNPSRRLSNLFFLFLGAAAVGLVVAVLAVSGVVDRTERVITAAPRPATATVAQPSADAGAMSEIYAQTSPAVAYVESGQGSGSGFLIDAQGHVVTNQHVVAGAPETAQPTDPTQPDPTQPSDPSVPSEPSDGEFTVRFGEEGEALPAKLIGEDASTDLAVLQVDPDKVPAETQPLELASSGELRPGDVAIAIGSPFGLSGTVTTGIVSALGREIDSPNGFQIPGAVQTDAAINPGNSGGPLLDAEGRVIGVNSQIASSSRQSSGVGFAVAVDTLKEVIPQLIESGVIERAYVGVSSIEEPGTLGAVVAAIAPGGPAASSELATGDRIVRIDDRDVATPSDLSDAVLEHKPGDSVQLTVERDGEERTIAVTLEERPDELAQQPQG